VTEEKRPTEGPNQDEPAIPAPPEIAPQLPTNTDNYLINNTSNQGQVLLSVQVGTTSPSSVVVYRPDLEEKLVRLDASRSDGERRKMVAEVVKMNGWPYWVKPSFVNIIKNLGCFEQVREMLEKGVGLVKIANQIKAHGEMLDQAIGTIENYLTHYKATIPKHLIARKQLKIPEAEQALRSSLDVRQKMIELYNRMEKRIEIGFNREQQMNFLMSGMEKQFEVAAKILKDIYNFDKEQGFGEYGAIARDGERKSLPSAPIDLDAVYSRTGINDTLQDPAKRQRIVSVVERLLDLGKKADDIGALDALDRAREDDDTDASLQIGGSDVVDGG
jgi:hypothetical protein